MAKNAYDKRFDEILAQYKARYEVDNLTSPNDKANLDTMIRNGIAIEQLQKTLSDLVQQDVMTNSTQINRINTAINDLIETNMKIERQLSIDRKTRKNEAEVNPAEYIAGLKKEGHAFLNDPRRLTKVYCKACQVMVGRISGVYDTTEFNAKFQCPQCKKYSTVARKEKDIFFDVRDADWRQQYPVEIVQPKRGKHHVIDDVNDDVVLGEDDIIYDEDQ